MTHTWHSTCHFSTSLRYQQEVLSNMRCQYVIWYPYIILFLFFCRELVTVFHRVIYFYVYILWPSFHCFGLAREQKSPTHPGWMLMRALLASRTKDNETLNTMNSHTESHSCRLSGSRTRINVLWVKNWLYAWLIMWVHNGSVCWSHGGFLHFRMCV